MKTSYITMAEVRIRSKEVKAEIITLLSDRANNKHRIMHLFAERRELSAIWDCFLSNQEVAYARSERAAMGQY